MIIWSVAGSFYLFRYIFKDYSADMRFLSIGSVLPLILNFLFKILGVNYEILLMSHSLISVLIIFSFVMLFTKRSTELRKKLLLICIGMFFSLFLNFVWLNQTVFFYPLFNYQFSEFDVQESYINTNFQILLNTIGAFYVFYKFKSRTLVNLFLKTGKII